MNLRDRVKHVLTLLDMYYEIDTKCYLQFEKPWQLLFSTILSAQCTDDRVNLVAESLYKKYTSIESFATASQKELENDVRSTGFYHNKAKNIIACAGLLLSEHGGILPSSVEALTALPGVGRKTANVVLGNIFDIPSIVVDTHVKRVSKRIGFTDNTDPEKIEFDLMKILPKKHWIRYNHQIIAHGRKICTARKARCEECFLSGCCKKAI